MHSRFVSGRIGHEGQFSVNLLFVLGGRFSDCEGYLPKIDQIHVSFRIWTPSTICVTGVVFVC